MFNTAIIQIKQDNIVTILIKSQTTLNIIQLPPRQATQSKGKYSVNVKTIRRINTFLTRYKSVPTCQDIPITSFNY